MDDESLHSIGTHNELVGDPNFTALPARCPASDANDRSVRAKKRVKYLVIVNI
jgi:hypothetical protein